MFKFWKPQIRKDIFGNYYIRKLTLWGYMYFESNHWYYTFSFRERFASVEQAESHYKGYKAKKYTKEPSPRDEFIKRLDN